MSCHGPATVAPPQIDHKALFDRKDCSIFGWSLDKTDLQYVLELNEPCFVKLEPLPESDGDCEVKDTKW